MSKRLVVIVLVLAAVGAVGGYLSWKPSPENGEVAAENAKATYQCSMHPQIVSDKPGICPICQMKLQRVDDGGIGKNAVNGERKIKFYRHPMRADVVSPLPAKDEMGMDYIPVYEDEAERGPGGVPGHAAFTLSTERQQLIGVTKGVVERRNLTVDIRAVGRVAYDPKLYQAIVEYRQAMRSRAEIAQSPLREAHTGSDALVRGAHLKLRQQGLSDAQIRELTSGANDPIELLLPGDSVWVYAQIYEYEAPLVHPGQTMVITAPSQPGRRYEAKVAAVDPILDPMTRTVRVRGLVPTPDKSLRPESFVHVTLRVPLGEKLAVPQEAVLDTGEHQIVFVVKDEGRFEPRSVQLGRDTEGYYEVLSGLDAGDQVVTSANFLIDSESRFRAALAAFKGGSDGHDH